MRLSLTLGLVFGSTQGVRRLTGSMMLGCLRSSWKETLKILIHITRIQSTRNITTGWTSDICWLEILYVAPTVLQFYRWSSWPLGEPARAGEIEAAICAGAGQWFSMGPKSNNCLALSVTHSYLLKLLDLSKLLGGLHKLQNHFRGTPSLINLSFMYNPLDGFI